ncbi:hypothetical protein [Flavobacterium pallidum]|nr:hypothetical protein [Flavobacterium pallidum]
MKTMKQFLVAILMMMAMSGCKSAQTQANASGDGSSYENAVVVKSVGEEYAFVKSKCTGCRVTSQALSNKDGKYYDVLYVSTADGKEVKYFFDINSFYGNW